MNNARNLLDAVELLGGRPLSASFAEAMLCLPNGGGDSRTGAAETLDDWLVQMPATANDPTAGRLLAEELRSRIGDGAGSGLGSFSPEPTATARTARRRWLRVKRRP